MRVCLPPVAFASTFGIRCACSYQQLVLARCTLTVINQQSLTCPPHAPISLPLPPGVQKARLSRINMAKSANSAAVLNSRRRFMERLNARQALVAPAAVASSVPPIAEVEEERVAECGGGALVPLSPASQVSLCHRFQASIQASTARCTFAA